MWMDWMDEKWPGFMDKRPKWLEGMQNLEREYGPVVMDHATDRLRSAWRPDQWGIGNRPPTWAEFRAVLDETKRPDWVMRNYPHMRQIVGGAVAQGNDWRSMGRDEQAEFTARMRRILPRTVKDVVMPKPQRAA